MLLSPRWTFLTLLLFSNTARSYGFENVTIEEDMFRANLVERADAPGRETMQIGEVDRHIVAIGDVHGNLDNLKKVLYMAGVTDKAGNWGKSEHSTTDRVRENWEDPPDFLVQVGDIMDRGLQVKQVFQYFDKLREQAPGKIFTLFGNHEWMNLIGDWRSVNETEMKEYNNDEGARYHEIYKGEIGISLKKHFITALRLPLHPLAGEPNQPCDPANESPLSDAALAFVHAGFSSKDSNLLDRFPERINQVTASLLEKVQAQVEPPKAYPFNRDVPMPTKPPFQIDANETALLDRDDGPLWYRGWGTRDKDKLDCSKVGEILRIMRVRRVIIGHTIRSTIRSRCDGTLVLVDTGMSKGNLAALFIKYSVRHGKDGWQEEEILTVLTPSADKKSNSKPLLKPSPYTAVHQSL